MDTVFKNYKINITAKLGITYYNISDVATKICNMKSDEFFRRKIYNRVKINKQWYGTTEDIIKGIHLCGKKSAKRFISDNRKYTNQYINKTNKLDNDDESDDELDDKTNEESDDDASEESNENISEESEDDKTNAKSKNITNTDQKSYDIINLKYSEKLKDNNGNIIEIEVRGKRNSDKYFFKVYDIKREFNMPNLQKTIITKITGYKEYIHYQYLYIPKNYETGFSKKLFLTFAGFRRVINVSKSIKYYPNVEILNKWLLQFDSKLQMNKYVINNEINKYLLEIGFTYCATSPIIDFAKIGFWRGTEEGLRSRYVTYYGNDVNLYIVRTLNPCKLETKCKKNFADYNVTPCGIDLDENG
jgi:hypothetical protein